MRKLISLIVLGWILGVKGLYGQLPTDRIFFQIVDNDGSESWVAACGNTTYRINSSGIASFIRLESREKLACVKSRIQYNGAAVTMSSLVGIDPVPFPIRIYSSLYPDGIEVTAYQRLQTPSGGAFPSLTVTFRGERLVLSRDSDRGSAELKVIHESSEQLESMDLTRIVPMTQRDIKHSLLRDDYFGVVQADRIPPVVFSDPRVRVARIVNPGSVRFDPLGNVILTSSPPYLGKIPLTSELIDDSIPESFRRVVKLDSTMNVEWCIMEGPYGKDPVFDSKGNAYHAYSTTNRLPRSSDSYNSLLKGGRDIGVSKWSHDGRLLWSTIIGGSMDDNAGPITINSNDDVIVTGRSLSTDFPTAKAEMPDKPNWDNREDVVLFSLSQDGTALSWSTYWGTKDTKTYEEYRYSVGSSPTAICATGEGTFTLAMNQFYPGSLPGNVSWTDQARGALESVVSMFAADGNNIWSTFLTTTSNDRTYSLYRDTDSSVLVRFNVREGDDYFLTDRYETLPSIGVPGETQTPDGNRDFWVRLSNNGQPLLVWAPFKAKSTMIPMGQNRWVSSPIGPATIDSFGIRPVWVKPGQSFPPAFSFVESTDYVNFKPVFTSQLFGYYPFLSASVECDALPDGRVVFGSGTLPGDGACVTDTLWGVGDEGQSVGWFVLLNNNVVTSVSEKPLYRTVDNTFSCYPNPSYGEIFITSQNAKLVRIEISDVLGRVILPSYETDLPARIDINHVSGPVFVRMYDLQTQLLTSKVIVVE